MKNIFENSNFDISEELKEKVVVYIKTQKEIGVCSICGIQKELSLGYEKACRIIDWLLDKEYIKRSLTPYTVNLRG